MKQQPLEVMAQSPEEKKEQHPDRPLECSECKKPITIHYTEIVGNNLVHIGMCSECPQLQKRLKGAAHVPDIDILARGKAGLDCGECGTTLDNIRVGHVVGCSNCYEVFGEILLDELLASNKISHSITKKKRAVPLHVGRSPGETQEISPSLRLIALNEALDETLKKEDYEQAAWLRDQIKEITEETENTNGKKG